MPKCNNNNNNKYKYIEIFYISKSQPLIWSH